MGLLGIAKQQGDDAVLKHRNHANESVRMGVLLAARRLQSERMVDFLSDDSLRIVAEAARAINDEPIESGLAALAKLDCSPLTETDSGAIKRRVLNANLRLGGADHFRTVAAIAANPQQDEAIRIEALTIMTNWNDPPPLDRVNGRWWPIADRPELDEIPKLIEPHLKAYQDGEEAQVAATIDLLIEHPTKAASPWLSSLITDDQVADAVRAKALTAAYPLNRDRKVLNSAIASSSPDLRARARSMLVADDVDDGLTELKKAILKGELAEQQAAIQDLIATDHARADEILLDTMNQEPSQATNEIQLDLMLAAEERSKKSKAANEFSDWLTKIESSRNAEDHLAEYRECLEGGNAKRGKDIVFGRTEASCRRCHMVGGEGGAVGPDLSVIGAEKNREYLLEAIVEPSRQIAKGFETVMLIMDDGKIVSGIVKEQDDETMTLMDELGGTLMVEKSEIDEQSTGKSGMPDLLEVLTKSDLRDIIEYLSSLKTPVEKQDAGH